MPKTIVPSTTTKIMGVLNITPDSFSDGGMYLRCEDAVKKAIQMAEDGAGIIDIGGESSRPGAESVSVKDELDRVIPVIKGLKGKIDIPISIDTCKSEVAVEALSHGAGIINDITALSGDKNMASVISEYGAQCILMHMKGRPAHMQESAEYDNVVEEVFAFLADAVEMAQEAGIDPDKIIIDPGIGFGKTAVHNVLLLRELKTFKKLKKPILIGTSRKSFLGTLTGKDKDERIFSTCASVAAAVMNGADIVRVHDVKEVKDVIVIIDGILGK